MHIIVIIGSVCVQIYLPVIGRQRWHRHETIDDGGVGLQQLAGLRPGVTRSEHVS